MENPLMPQLRQILENSPQGVSEYEILQQLEGHAAFSELSEASDLSLFQKHFLVMNGLYLLQQQLWQEGECYLEVSPLKVVTHLITERVGEEALVTEGDHLSAYYRDWRNLEGMDEAGVEELLDRFWNRFVVEDQRGPALLTLGLEVGVSRDEIAQRYRQLAAQHHPDKGGDPGQFIEIRQAYEVLMA